MTLAAVAPISTYLEDGTSRTFATGFQFETSAEIAVTRIAPDGTRSAATLGTDFSVAGGAGSNGSVTTTIAKPAGWEIEIQRVTPRTQPMDYTPGDTFPAESHEAALDRVTAIVQEVEHKVDDFGARALQVPKGETVAPLASALQRASTWLGFDLSGVPKLFNASAMASALVAALVAVLPANLKGDPGGNAFATGLFASLAAQSVPAGTDKLITTGYAAARDGGGATYVYDPAVDAAFVTAHPRWSVRTANGRGFRIDEMQYLRAEMFGAVADFDHGPAGTTNGQGHTFGGTNVPVTDSYPAQVAIQDFQKYFADWPSWNQSYKPVPFVTWGRGAYYSSDTWNFPDTTNQLGEGNGGTGGFGSTVIWFAAHKCGVIFQAGDTTGIASTKAASTTPYNRGASDSVFKGFSLFSLDGTVGAAEYGILMKCRVDLDMVGVGHFGGHGIYIRANHFAGYGGNANGWALGRCAAVNCGGDALKIEGSDANAGIAIQFSAFNNLGFGLNENSDLGNRHLMLQTAGNGCFGAGPFWAPVNFYSTFCNYLGDVYRVRPGQEVAARTTTPGTNSAVWVLYAAGAVSTLGPTWVSGMTNWVSGGMLWVQGGSNRSTIDGYGETTSEALPWSDAPNSFCLPGNLGTGGPGLFVIAGKVLSNRLGSLNIASGNDYQFTLGGKSGDAASVLARVGFNISGSDAPWTWSVDANNTLSWSYNGLGGTSPIDYIGNSGNHPYSAALRNGHFVGGLFVASGGAAPTSGTWERGSRIYNDGSATALSVTDHWVCSVAGTPGTWIAKA